ncbi:MAG TPA: FAD-binding oxidoreductase [Candidatus Limnocylindrales bacterium]
MRRWNGWGDDSIEEHVPDRAMALLHELVGPSARPRDATLDEVVAAVRPSRLEPHAAPGVALGLDPLERVRHARGHSLPDWIALRTGRLGATPDAIARPADSADVAGLLASAAARGWTLVPYGGGTSVVGGVTVEPSDRPVVTVDLAELAGLHHLDETSGLATFGAGTFGPALEAALLPRGLTLGHYPQSFESSTLGGWVATRSVGQQAHGYGRIDELFAGGRLETPRGPLDLPPHPASAAGPDLRQAVLGSEGRIGILTDVTVRASRIAQLERFSAYVVPDWERALELARRLGQSGLPLSMARVSTPLETATTFALAGDRRGSGLLRRYLGWRGQGPDRCLVTVGLTGDPAIVGATARAVDDLVRGSHGVAAPGVGPAWRRSRFTAPYLRNALWDAGYAVDTLETATDWKTLPALATELARGLRHGLEPIGERVHAFSHLSHPYGTGSSLYTSYVFRLAGDPEETLQRWRTLKSAASEVIIRHGATISHQHGVGTDHAPYLAAEKGPLGMRAIEALVREFDPDGVLHRGVLLEDRPG